MSRVDPVLRLQALIASAGADAEAAEWAAHGLSAWLNFGGSIPLPRCLGLPASPKDIRIRLRNRWLAEAFTLLADDTTPWKSAQRLRDAARHFEAYKWPAWESDPMPPSHATDIQRMLFFARKNAEFPATTEMFRKIMSETE